MKPAVNLLLVEDDVVEVTALRRACVQRGLANSLHVAENGVEALQLLDAAAVPRPYIILLDLNMPRMNGLEFLRALRAHPRHRDAVVFVVTGSVGDREKQEAYAANIAGFVDKAEAGPEFGGLLEMLERYWSVVDLP